MTTLDTFVHSAIADLQDNTFEGGWAGYIEDTTLLRNE